jgi:hypothetical protein
VGADNKGQFAAEAHQRQNLQLDTAATYDCPVCRHGQIQAMPLMDAYACNFCRHILEANLDQQTVHIVDGAQPMGWRWLGGRWQPIYQSSSDLTLTLWVVGLALMLFPSGIVALGAYLFPPLEPADGIQWSLVWAVATLVAHTLMVGWLIAEHYQFPPYVLAKIRLQRFIQHLVSGE